MNLYLNKSLLERVITFRIIFPSNRENIYKKIEFLKYERISNYNFYGVLNTVDLKMKLLNNLV